MKKRYTTLGVGVVLLMTAMLFGCQHMIDPGLTYVPFETGEEIPDDGNGTGVVSDYVENFPVVDADQELMPLAAGNRWYYRNATADRLPTRQAIREISMEVESETQVLGKIECFVVVIRQGEAAPERHFWHRGEEGIYEVGVASEGTTTMYAEPILLVPIPVKAGTEWSYSVGGETINARVLLQETVATTMLGIFQNCWRIERATEADVRVEWYTAGHGIVKIVRDNSVFEPILIETGSVSLGIP